MPLNCVLLGEGPSDRALIPILRWTLKHLGYDDVVRFDWADLGRLPNKPVGLTNRIKSAVDLYPSDLLFVHRDADTAGLAARTQEVINALAEAPLDYGIPVIPVREMEAWLLGDEKAIRRASGRPSGTGALYLPRINQIEGIADPKTRLRTAILTASEATGRRRKKLEVGSAIQTVAEETQSFRHLQGLPAFQQLLNSVRARLDALAQ